MTARAGAEHNRVRPSWICAVCGQPWPCPDARNALLHEFGRFPSVLTVFMATQMYDAFDDLAAQGRLPTTVLHERFLGWIPIPPPEAEGGDVASSDRPEGEITGPPDERDET